MSWRTQFKRGLGGMSPSTPPAASSSAINDVIDAAGAAAPRKHIRFIETASATVGVNRGTVPGDMTYVNVADWKYRLASLVNGSNNSGRSMAAGGTIAAPAHGTISALVTTKSCTITLWCQPGRLTTKMIAVTQGLAQSVAGAMSPIELENDGQGGYRIRSWVSIGGVARVMTSSNAAPPVGGGCVIEYKQTEGAGRFIRVNGALVASNTAFTAFETPAAQPFYVGCWSDGSAPFRGLFAELVGWDESLSDAASLTIGGRATSILELSLLPAQSVAANSGGTIDLIALGVVDPDVDWEVEVVSYTANASLLTFAKGANPQQIEWTSGSAGTNSPTIRIVRGATVSTTRTLAFTVEAQVTAARCYEGAGGAVTTFPAADNYEERRNLSVGGAARYNAHNVVNSFRWLGEWNSNALHATSNQFFYLITAPHNGGCISGISFYGNTTKEIDYDPSGGNERLYPQQDAGQLFMGNNSNNPVLNFTAENMRGHSGWDSVRLPGRWIEGFTLQDSWFTCQRDEVIENDANAAPLTIRRLLVGDTCPGPYSVPYTPTQSGCHRFFSMTSANDANIDREILIEDVLWWSSRFRISGRTNPISINGVGGFVVGEPMKFQNFPAKPKVRMRRCVYMCDGKTFTGTGDPFFSIRRNDVFIERTACVFIWTEAAQQAHGSWASQGFSLPSGFTLLEGIAGRNEWNGLVAEWKQDHPNVRRFNKTGIPRLYGGTFNLVDTG